MRRLIYIAAMMILLQACGEGVPGLWDLLPEHCRLPTASSLPTGDVQTAEFWLPGSLAVSSTLPWPECPSLDGSTARSDDPPRITYPGDGEHVAEGRWPAVIFTHANSVDVCNPTDRYRSLHEQWASWGWITYSVDTSEENCRDWTSDLAKSRVAKMRAALDDLRRRNGDPRSRFHGRIAVDRVVAVGHSRGGAAALALVSDGGPWIGGISLQGGNPPRYGLGDTFVERPVLGISGELDEDLSFPHVELNEELLRGRYSWHTIRRGNHDYTADGLPMQNDDDPDEILSRASQLELTKYLTTSYLAANFGVWDGDSLQPRANAEPVIYTHFGDEYARRFLRGDGFISRWDLGPEHDAVWIDRFDSRAVGAENVGTPRDPQLNDLGLANDCGDLARCEEVWTYEPDAKKENRRGYRLPSSLLLEADEAARWTTRVDRDVPPGWQLHARVRRDADVPADFDVVLPGDGGDRRIAGKDVVNTTGISRHFVQLVVDLEPGPLDLVGFELRSGRLYVDDLRLVAP